MARLFEPITLAGLTIPNRVWLSPMCQYMAHARDGMPNDWHLVHLGSRAVGGFGLLISEAAAVDPVGRISPEDVGLWEDSQVAPWRRITDFVHEQGSTIAVQLAHAGRKASTYRAHPGQGKDTVPQAEGGWQTVAPSAVEFTGYAPPRALEVAEIEGVVQAFADAAARADEAGFDAIDIHAAHGYLLHQFCSPLSNQRTDAHGGDFTGRTRIVVEVVDAIRRVWPEHKPLFIRLSATDWLPDGWDVEQTAELVRILGDHGVDLADVSSGGLLPSQQIAMAPSYQAGFARQVRERSGVPTSAVGLITTPEQAERHLQAGDADVILLGREALRQPYWPLDAARSLGVPDWRDRVPAPYYKGAPTE